MNSDFTRSKERIKNIGILRSHVCFQHAKTKPFRFVYIIIMAFRLFEAQLTKSKHVYRVA